MVVEHPEPAFLVEDRLDTVAGRELLLPLFDVVDLLLPVDGEPVTDSGQLDEVVAGVILRDLEAVVALAREVGIGDRNRGVELGTDLPEAFLDSVGGSAMRTFSSVGISLQRHDGVGQVVVLLDRGTGVVAGGTGLLHHDLDVLLLRHVNLLVVAL
ncbi:MAG: hypothetical protein ABEK12_03445 [Candidatus Nanohaloarchaea archaeon]